MDEYISRKAVVKYLKGYSEKELNHNGHFGMITSSVLDKAERAISEMPAADVQPVSHWISVKDRLPIGKINPITQDFELVICATTFGDVRAYGYGKPKGHDKAHFWFGAGIVDEYVTHWMPLPEPPESEVQDGNK